MKRWAGVVALASLVWACHAERRPPEEPDWAGVTLALRPAEAALAVGGTLRGVPVEVRLEIARTLSMATDSCFAAKPRGKRFVRVPLAAGGLETQEEEVLSGLTLGKTAVPAFKVARLAEQGACVVTLGMDLLASKAFEVDPVRREVHFLPASRARTTSAHELVAELSRDPTSDLMLLPVCLRTPDGRSDLSTFVVSTGLARSVLARATARRLGAEDADESLHLRGVELAPGMGPTDVDFTLIGKWGREGAVGILGRDVWRGAPVIVDLRAKRLSLRPVEVSGWKLGAETGCGAGGMGRRWSPIQPGAEPEE